MSWNYRLLRHISTRGDVYLAIHEVYYDEEGKPEACSAGLGDNVGGETAEEVRSMLHAMLNALGKPVLDYDSFVSERER